MLAETNSACHCEIYYCFALKTKASVCRIPGKLKALNKLLRLVGRQSDTRNLRTCHLVSFPFFLVANQLVVTGGLIAVEAQKLSPSRGHNQQGKQVRPAENA